MLNTLWLIPLLPLAGFLLNGLFGKRLGNRFVTAVALLASLGAAVAGTIAVVQYHAPIPPGSGTSTSSTTGSPPAPSALTSPSSSIPSAWSC